MSSTSSTDQTLTARSATESLAGRYRHLFALPSSWRLAVYGGAASLLFSVLSRGAPGFALPFVLAFAVFVLSGIAISSAVKIIDKKAFANFRRVLALLLAGEIFWAAVAVIGAVYGWGIGSSGPLTNAVLFGAFACIGLEFLIINGAFVKSGTVSLALACVHPTATALILRFPEPGSSLDPIAAACGVVVLALFTAFPSFLRRRRTSHGYDALSLFRAFMKTWVVADSDDLEEAITNHAEEVEVTTKIFRFRTKTGDVFLALPGVHPGPFHPVGSYDLPGVVSRAFAGLGPVMTLHRPGGHERNLTTRAETIEYARSIEALARSTSTGDGDALIRGPIRAKIGKANVSAFAFSHDVITTISFAPLGSDDLDTRVEAELSPKASEKGLSLSVVDAHNSIDHNLESPATEDPGWTQLFEEVTRLKAEAFSVGYAHSSEVGFTGRGDLTENGIGLFMVEAHGVKSALILADANNSIPALRGDVIRALDAAGYGLIEFCTSDSHNLAARGLTAERGYRALGEATPTSSIADLAVRLAKLAEGRLAPAAYGSGEAKTKVRVFGSAALEEFAAMTQSSSNFSRSYFRYTLAAVAVLLLTSILL